MVDRKSIITVVIRLTEKMRPLPTGGILRTYLRRFCLTIGLFAATALPLAGARAASIVAQVQAKSVKPLSLASVQSLDLGSIVLAPGSWSGATIGISRAGVFTCASANLTCSGAT